MIRRGASWYQIGYRLIVLLLALTLAACPTRAPAPKPVAIPAPERSTAAPHEGRPYEIVSAESLLRIVVYRGGALAKAGHNHVIASHAVTGAIYVPADLTRASFELHIPVAELTVDEPALRVSENSPDFPPDVPESAKEGTRRNMLSEALLDGARYPEIVLRAERLERVAGGAPNEMIAHAEVLVRDQKHSIIVPVRYELGADEVSGSGEMPLKQSDLGLTPFSALLGALQVQDEMRIKFRIVGHAAKVTTARGQ